MMNLRALLYSLLGLFCLVIGFAQPNPVLQAQSGIDEICPGIPIQPRVADFSPGGLIVTAFDATNMWVYDIGRSTRYPLPDTYPCQDNCQLSPDFRWLTAINPQTFIYYKMRLDGTERTPLASVASDVSWWDAENLLIWTPNHRAYIRSEVDTMAEPRFLDVRGVRLVQPGGYWGMTVKYDEDGFTRYLIDLENRDSTDAQMIRLASDRPYFNAAAWSPDGAYLAYVGQGAFDSNAGIAGGEIFLAQPGNAIPQQMTFFYNDYGAVRINGYAPGELSWSPDSSRLAFWVIELLGSNPEGNTGNAVLHLLNINTGDVVRYCGFSTTEHTPNPPRIVWSPDGSHIAFAGNVPGDDKGSLLLAMDVQSGILTELSDGVYPVFGQADILAWGLAP